METCPILWPGLEACVGNYRKGVWHGRHGTCDHESVLGLGRAHVISYKVIQAVTAIKIMALPRHQPPKAWQNPTGSTPAITDYHPQILWQSGFPRDAESSLGMVPSMFQGPITNESKPLKP